MIRYSLKALEKVEVDRSLQIESNVNRIKVAIDQINKRNGLEYKLDRSLRIYQNKFKEVLDVHESTILFINVLFNNSEEFLKIVGKYDYQFDQVTKIYCVNESLVRLAYDYFTSYKTLENKDVKVLNLKK